jgi:hypothetical protein
MNSFLSNIIDCVALPSTSDTPVRILRKCYSGSSASVCAEPLSSDDSAVSSVPPNQQENELDLVPEIKAVLTADGIIYVDDGVGRSIDAESDDFDNVLDCSLSSFRSSRSIDDGTQKQFEEAFASFLYKNPAYSKMSYTTLTRLRQKLFTESERNLKKEAELRMQLEQLKESNRRTELLIQNELLTASTIKSSKEAELLKRIQESRDDKADVGRYRSSSLLTSPADRVSPSYVGYSALETHYQPPITSWPCEEENYQAGMRKSKMEQAHIIAQMEKIKKEKMEREVSSILSANAEL